MASPEIGSRVTDPLRRLVNSRPGLGASVAEPGVECGDRVGGGVLAVDDGDDLAVGVLVGLGPADGEQDAAGLELDVGQREGGQLGAAHRRGEAEQDERGVAGAQGGAAVDVLDDLADVVGAERSGLAAGCGADDAAQAAADLANAFGEDRVGESVGGVLVGDGAAGEVDAADREPVGGAFGEVGADQRRLGGQRRGAAGGAPALPLAPRPVVHGAGGLGVGGGDRLGDPDGLLDGEAGGQVRVVGRRTSGAGFIQTLYGRERLVPRPARGRRQRPTLPHGVVPASHRESGEPDAGHAGAGLTRWRRRACRSKEH